jgi:hypothetical protein
MAKKLSQMKVGELTAAIRQLDPTRQSYVAGALRIDALASALTNRPSELAALPKETRELLLGCLQVQAAGYPEVRLSGGEVVVG